MKKFKAIKQREVIKLICDGCGLEASVDEGYEFSEFVCIDQTCGFGAIYGDGKQVTVDLCQHCFAGMCGDILTITDPLSRSAIALVDNVLDYDNNFLAVTQSKQSVNELKYESDITISVRDILSANKISNVDELQVALTRVEKLWDAQYHSVEGNELHTLADLICAYENKSWDSYFSQEPASDDFMSDRVTTIVNMPSQKSGSASGILSDIEINKNIDEDDSCQSCIDDENID